MELRDGPILTELLATETRTSLGCTLFQAVSGRLPFEGGVGVVIVHHLTTPAPLLEGVSLTRAHAGLTPLVQATLRIDPAQ